MKKLASILALALVSLGARFANAQTHPACLPSGYASGTGVHSAVFDAGALSFCLFVPDEDRPAPLCFRVELTSGAFTSLPRPAVEPPPNGPATAFVRSLSGAQNQNALLACSRTNVCARVALPGLVSFATANARGTRAIAVIGPADQRRVQWLSLPAGTPGASFRLPGQSPTAARIELLGDTALLYDCVEAGPGCTGSLLRDDGRVLAPVGDRDPSGAFNLYASTPLLLSDDRFAVAESDGSRVALQDPRTGRVLAQTALPSADSPERGARLVRAGAHLALVTAGARPGHVHLLDARTLATRARWALPVCPAR